MKGGEHLESGHAYFDGAGASSEGRHSASAAADIAGPIDPEGLFLKKLGFSKPFLAMLRQRAAANCTSLEAELLADGRVDHDAYYGALARVLDLPFLASIDPATVADRSVSDSQLLTPRMIRCYLPDRAPAIAIVPVAREIASGDASICRLPRLRERVVVTTPSALRDAVWQAGALRRVDQAAHALFETRPQVSARVVFWGSQGFLAGLSLALLAVWLLLAPSLALLSVHIVLTSGYFLATVLRGLAGHMGPYLLRPRPLEAHAELPFYTILVALYQEREVVGQLVDRLNKMNWPRSRLDIKFLCEEGDHDTVDALRAQTLRPEYEVVLVPDAAPRTKPKALNYGLTGARGDYVAVYDAEDRPHPDQLLEAYQTFLHASPHVVCLQAPLVISNARESWLSALFALEYSSLFRRLLPLLGSLGLPMPLGGTSNHFRISALKAAGGWDPYNVTEDADLGLRLYRMGYRADIIARPTLEDAPTDKRVWLGQRCRWLKGWMQTWLVLMRDPRRVGSELGSAGALAFHVLITGLLLSALGHPLIIGFLMASAWHMVHSVSVTLLEQILFGMDIFNTIGAYMLFILVGRKAMTPDERRRLGLQWCWVPVYWLLISYAAWKALIELKTNPFFWNKTPHKPSNATETATAQ